MVPVSVCGVTYLFSFASLFEGSRVSMKKTSVKTAATNEQTGMNVPGGLGLLQKIEENHYPFLTINYFLNEVEFACKSKQVSGPLFVK